MSPALQRWGRLTRNKSPGRLCGFTDCAGTKRTQVLGYVRDPLRGRYRAKPRLSLRRPHWAD